jgi:hypothetical protein
MTGKSASSSCALGTAGIFTAEHFFRTSATLQEWTTCVAMHLRNSGNSTGFGQGLKTGPTSTGFDSNPKRYSKQGVGDSRYEVSPRRVLFAE